MTLTRDKEDVINQEIFHFSQQSDNKFSKREGVKNPI